MKERPILFKGEMVRAILDGRKTQTRRLVKNPEFFGCLTGDCPHETQSDCDASVARDFVPDAPLGKPGDRLWVKETWRTVRALDDCKPSKIQQGATIEWAARGNNLDARQLYDMAKNWRSPLFMMQWMSRLTLELTAVRCERLQDISEADAVAEGVKTQWCDDQGETPGRLLYFTDSIPTGIGYPSAKFAYGTLWTSINGPGSWDKNPWVWVYTFKKL